MALDVGGRVGVGRRDHTGSARRPPPRAGRLIFNIPPTHGEHAERGDYRGRRLLLLRQPVLSPARERYCLTLLFEASHA